MQEKNLHVEFKKRMMDHAFELTQNNSQTRFQVYILINNITVTLYNVIC